ncbi:dicarboxylate/amino acid:cation symporter [Zooshikella ganghwensis]|uniref:dicarboxylate/amino acid:cation symporter n=1 Tax=Zooshikella ganghwensis TaxID=202772 RepID=UPI0004012DA9|nr:dicarboxylate/amino acid:cation symporter [Zooshikella ganghwensis]
MSFILRKYLAVPLLIRILASFVSGSLIGCLLWWLSYQVGQDTISEVLSYITPFGEVFVKMLKMIVIPVIFFSLVVGAASLPLQRFGKIGVKVLGWYFFCSLLAATVGVIIALAVDPGSNSQLSGWHSITQGLTNQASDISSKAAAAQEQGLATVLLSMFENPFTALSEGNFLAIITFSILFGLALRVIQEKAEANNESSTHLVTLFNIINAARDCIFKLVDWIMEYTPIGVFALSIGNFALYGPSIAGPYINVAFGVIVAVLLMVFVVYPMLLAVTTRQNPLPIMKKMQEAIITAFITRSSAATLPVSLRTIEEDLKVKNELASFSLPLGATINMDGVCVHLPMFAILAANMFGFDLGFGSLLVMVLTTVLASIGAGGVPGGSLMLLFIILQGLGLSQDQVAIIVALALGINPILDMFETANNVTGDMVCTYAVAKQENLLEDDLSTDCSDVSANTGYQAADTATSSD